jgi:hypothetical protein
MVFIACVSRKKMGGELSPLVKASCSRSRDGQAMYPLGLLAK